MIATRRILVLVLLLGVAMLCVPVCAGDDKSKPVDARELTARYKAKLEMAFMQKIAWHKEFRKALKEAGEKQLPVLAYFTRSDRQWPPSEELESEELLAAWWVEASERFVPYVHVHSGLDLPEDTVQRTLVGAEQVPIFVVTDKNGDRIVRFRLNDASDLERALGEAEELLATRRQVVDDPKNKVAKAKLALLEGMRQDKPDFKDLDRAAATKGLEPGLIERYRTFASVYRVRLVLKEMEEQLEKGYAAGSNAQFADIHAKSSSKMYKLYKDGVRIKERTRESEPVHRSFWDMAFDGAIAAKDRPVAGETLDAFEKAYGAEDGAKKRVQEMKDLLAGLR